MLLFPSSPFAFIFLTFFSISGVLAAYELITNKLRSPCLKCVLLIFQTVKINFVKENIILFWVYFPVAPG